MGVTTMPLNTRENAQHKTAHRIEALMVRHAELERQIHAEMKRPAMSETLIRQLKARKLRVKEEIEEVHSGTSG
jgi:hypothetical protein